MKAKVLFLSSVICICGMACARASECTGDDCDINGGFSFVQTVTTPGEESESHKTLIMTTNIGPCSMSKSTSDTTSIEDTAFNPYNDCPFETDIECDIWRTKPMMRETVSPRSPKIRDDKMFDFLASINCSGNINANSPAAAPLIERYKMLMKSTRACCTEGMIYQLRKSGASNGLVYKFMSDDANFYNIGNRCLMTTDAELDEQYPETATASVISDVRNGCLCRGREWFKKMLAPFVDAWNASPEFASSPFLWTYTDGLNRRITVSINNDVRNILNQLETCP